MDTAPNTWTIPDSKAHGANMGPTWVLSSPGGPHVGPMSLAIRDDIPLIEIPTATIADDLEYSFESIFFRYAISLTHYLHGM